MQSYSMSFLFWNVRGLNKPFKQTELGKFLRNNGIVLAGVLETRVKEPNAQKCIDKIARGWQCCCNYPMAYNGRIWLLWKAAEVDVQVIRVHSQFIHCKVTGRNFDFSCALSVVYGKNSVEEREDLWTGLKEVGTGFTDPWYVCGDFNVVLTTRDRINGHIVTESECRGLSSFMADMNLTIMKSAGNEFTWSNGHVSRKIDRALCDTNWVSAYGQSLRKGTSLIIPL